MKTKIYVGLNVGKREIFRSAFEPTTKNWGRAFAAVVGPFRTKRAAELMRDYGKGNPHMACVADCERLARAEKVGKVSF